MRSRIAPLITGLAILGASVLTTCGAPAAPPTPMAVPPAATPAPAPTIADPTGLGPAETVSAFYAWYLDYASGRTRANPLVDEAYREIGYVTESWGEEVAAIRSSPGGGFDPFLCAQDVPEQVIPFRVEEDNEKMLVEVRTSFPGHTFTVSLLQVGEAWQIDGVRCSGATVATPAVGTAPVVVGDGQYASAEFGFSVRYPLGWVVREVRSRAGEPPIGPESLRLMVLFMPPEWAEAMDRSGPPDPDGPVIAPLTLEVVLGTEEEFWASYPPPARREEVMLAQAPALFTVEEVTDEISLPRYIFTHPVAADLRVVLTDPISGFADRLAAHPEVAAAFHDLADSFVWLD